MPEINKFADLGRPRRIWAIGSIHAQLDRLHAIHEAVGARFQPGDRLVYLGNLVGWGAPVLETVETLLAFRRAVLSIRGLQASDIVYLRGSQEEMWQKLLQLQLAPNPREVLDWMLRQGVGPTLAAYGGSVEDGYAAARGGAVSLGRWTAGLRAAMQARPGHATLFNTVRRAAYTGTPDMMDSGGVLFVNAGIDPSKPFAAQADSFWWAGSLFPRIDRSFAGFRRVVRGFDPARNGVQVTDFTATIDGGSGFGGHLVAGAFTATGDVLELFQA